MDRVPCDHAPGFTCDLCIAEVLKVQAEEAEREWANPDPNKRWYRSRQR